jgi:hypothetical protein
MTAFARAEDAALKSDLLALTAIVRERRIVPHNLAGWFAVGMCVVFVVELVVAAAYAAWLISHFV